MIVYVINKHGEPLMPTNPVKARRLMKAGKAKIYKYDPFTIQLIYGSSGYKQPITLGVDTGFNSVGMAAVTEAGKVLYTAEAELRSDVSDLLKTRSMLRRTRRNNKTRYRKARYLNRKRVSGWLPPSIRARIQAHVKLISDVCSILPIKYIKVEVGRFDVQALVSPDIEGIEYQNGPQKGTKDIEEYVKIRDKFKCHYKDLRTDIICSGKMEVDHMNPKSRGGSDRPDNRVCSCAEHNRVKGSQTYKAFTGRSLPKVKSFKATPFMNALKNHLVPLLSKLKPITYTYGYTTCETRAAFDLEKSHINDAIAVVGIQPTACIGNSYQIKQVRKKKRSLHQMTPYYSKKGNPDSKRNKKNTKEIIVKGKRWCLWDKVKVDNSMIGFISGFGTPDFNIKNINGKKLFSINVNHVTFICRNNNWIAQNS